MLSSQKRMLLQEKIKADEKMRRTPKVGRKRKLSGWFFTVKKQKCPLKELFKVSGLTRKLFIYYSAIEKEFGTKPNSISNNLIRFFCPNFWIYIKKFRQSFILFEKTG